MVKRFGIQLEGKRGWSAYGELSVTIHGDDLGEDCDTAMRQWAAEVSAREWPEYVGEVYGFRVYKIVDTRFRLVPLGEGESLV